MLRADDAVKVVYHLSDEQSATLAMFNISNHLAADPGAKIVLVALSRGVKVFAFGAQDSTSRPFAEWVDQLTAKGVEFRVCQNSMNACKLSKAIWSTRFRSCLPALRKLPACRIAKAMRTSGRKPTRSCKVPQDRVGRMTAAGNGAMQVRFQNQEFRGEKQ